MTNDPVRIVQLSDLHFGTKGQSEIWQSLLTCLNEEIKPDLILVTGDIVDTPSKTLYQTAHRELGLLRNVGGIAGACQVCPGNHDRHPKGNAPGPLKGVLAALGGRSTVSAWFDQTFTGMIPTVKTPADFDLSRQSLNWHVRVIGFDSSINAEYSAQGYAGPEELAGLIRTAKAATDFDLVIVMHHHHLLPIKELEQRRQVARDLFRPTIMLNAGTVLEALSRGHINMVVHGHEHQRAIARYGTLDGQENEIVVVGAGSAIGNRTLDGCDFGRSSFNIIELNHDRSVSLREATHDGLQWRMKEPVTILDDRAIRRARFYRRSNPTAAPTSKVLTCLEFHRDRNINYSRIWTNWAVDGGEWTHKTTNSSGWPSSARVEFDWPGNEPEIFDNVRFLKDSSDYHTYHLRVHPHDNGRRLARQIAIKFQWQGGAVLTQNDFGYLDENTLGPYRRQGLEFAAVRAHNDLESLSLLVRLPPLFAPKLNEVRVFVEEPSGATPKPSEELARALQQHASGTFSFDLPYPRRGYRYVLAWRPVEGPRPAPRAERFRNTVRIAGNADTLLSAFAAELRTLLFFEHISFGMYIPPSHESTHLIKVAEIVSEHAGPQAHPPNQLSLLGPSTLHRHAWWGQIQAALADRDGTERMEQEAGFLVGERALVVIPVRDYAQKGGLSWALIRLSINTGCSTSDEQLLRALDSRRQEGFANGLTAVLHGALQLERGHRCD